MPEVIEERVVEPPTPPADSVFELLGGPCPQPPRREVRCSEGGVVSAVYSDPLTFQGHLPPDADPLYERHSNDKGRAGVSVYWNNGAAWMVILDCGGCTPVGGWSFAALPTELSNDDYQSLIQKTGLPELTPLTSRTDWADADWDAVFQELPAPSSSDAAATKLGGGRVAPAPPSKPAPKKDKAEKEKTPPPKTGDGDVYE